jgi:hypothetical protein
MATRDIRRRLAPPTPVPGHTLDPSSGDAMPRTVPSLASLGAVSAGIPKEATARPHKGQARHSNLLYLVAVYTRALYYIPKLLPQGPRE